MKHLMLDFSDVENLRFYYSKNRETTEVFNSQTLLITQLRYDENSKLIYDSLIHFSENQVLYYCKENLIFSKYFSPDNLNLSLDEMRYFKADVNNYNFTLLNQIDNLQVTLIKDRIYFNLTVPYVIMEEYYGSEEYAFFVLDNVVKYTVDYIKDSNHGDYHSYIMRKLKARFLIC